MSNFISGNPFTAGDTVTAAKLNDMIQLAQIVNGTVTTAKIGDNQVTAPKIASNAVGSAQIASSAVTEAQILDSAVTTGKIANLAVTEGKLAALAVTTGKLAAKAVTADKLNDIGAVGIWWDSKASGTNGGTFTQGAWQARTLTALAYDSHGLLAAPASGTNFSLPAGTWLIEAQAPAYQVQSHQLRLYNVTAAAVTAHGITSRTSGANTQSDASLAAVVVLSGATVFRIEHRCSDTTNNTGFGLAANFGGNEIYTMVKVTKLK
jgi:hypothetical protein